MGDEDGAEGDEVGVEVKVLELVSSFLGNQYSDVVTARSELVGEVDIGSHVAHGEPREHGYVEARGIRQGTSRNIHSNAGRCYLATYSWLG